jgi:hypothetical protein
VEKAAATRCLYFKKAKKTGSCYPVNTNETMLLQAMSNRWCRSAQLLCAHCLLLIADSRCEAQNLVQNASFEQIEECPTFPTMLGFQTTSKPTYWEKWLNSPDYFNACVDTMTGVPGNVFGQQHAWDGQAYIGMMVFGNFGDEFREFAGVELIEPLQVGVTYHLSFWVCAAEGTTSPPGAAQPTHWAANNIGLLFTMEHNIWTGFQGPPFPPRNYAHLHAQEVIADTANWVLVSGEFVADSAYLYLAIGNFFENAFTDTLHVTPGPSSGAYVYVDGVCVTQNPTGCDFASGVGLHGRPLDILPFPNPASTTSEVRLGQHTDAEWVILDVLGKLVGHGRTGGKNVPLDVSTWPVGTYTMLVGGKDRSVVRFVVMH